jgi:hypothetical protein
MGMYCDKGDIAIGGSCTYYGTDPRMQITFSGGDIAHPDYPESWYCGWHSNTQEWQEVATTVICVRPEAAPSELDDCDCPDFEPIAQRIVRIARSEPFQGYATNELTVECPAGAILLAGGCADQWPISGAMLDMTLSRSGFSTEDAIAWHCDWNTPVQTDGEVMLATAYCLQPPTYGPDPLEGRITRVSKTQNVPAGSFASFTASCAPDDFLLSGSCMLDSADPLSHQAILYHHGLDATDPTAWRCAWHNPTTLNLPATAMVTCATNQSE